MTDWLSYTHDQIVFYSQLYNMYTTSGIALKLIKPISVVVLIMACMCPLAYVCALYGCLGMHYLLCAGV